jgi:hypothetical protein
MTSALVFLAAVASRFREGFSRMTPLSYLWVCTLGQVILWRRLSEVPHWPGPSAGALSLVLAGVATAALSVFAGRLMVRREDEVPSMLPEPRTIVLAPEVPTTVPAASDEGGQGDSENVSEALLERTESAVGLAEQDLP